MTSDLNTTFGHRHHLYSATLLYFYAPHLHSSFLIPHSNKAFFHNQGGSPLRATPRSSRAEEDLQPDPDEDHAA